MDTVLAGALDPVHRLVRRSYQFFGRSRDVRQGRDGAVSVATRIRERISEHMFLETDGLKVRLTASVGVATLPDVAGSAEELIRAADKAMYRVKDAGKNGIHVAEEDE